ncbi:MAG: spore germination protein amino acid permease [Paenibacillus sp.]|nr:spore germination protein amino acid permease [Paenibacillus sp.]
MKGSAYSASWFGICIMMGMLMPHQANPKRTFRMKAYAVSLGSLLMTLYLLYCIGVMGPYMAARLENPIYTFTRITKLFIFERIEVLLLLVFITGTFITISTLYFSVSEGISQLLGERWRKAALYGFGGLFVLSPVLPFRHNSSLVDQYLSNWFPVVALSVEGGLTTIVFLAAYMKKRLRPIK